MKAPIVLTLLAASLTVTGCTSGPPTPTVSASQSPDSIPNGTYSTTATRQEALDAGFSKKLIDKNYGSDWNSGYVAFKFLDGRFSILVGTGEAAREAGDLGSYTINGSTLVTKSESEGCNGCVYTYRWALDGSVLSLKLVTSGSDVRLVTEHDYTRE
jgi:hypothetical protein